MLKLLTAHAAGDLGVMGGRRLRLQRAARRKGLGTSDVDSHCFANKSPNHQVSVCFGSKHVTAGGRNKLSLRFVVAGIVCNCGSQLLVHLCRDEHFHSQLLSPRGSEYLIVKRNIFSCLFLKAGKKDIDILFLGLGGGGGWTQESQKMLPRAGNEQLK